MVRLNQTVCKTQSMRFADGPVVGPGPVTLFRAALLRRYCRVMMRAHHHPVHIRHRIHSVTWLETFSTVTLHGAGCFVSKAMAMICSIKKSISPPVVWLLVCR
jgi:hypothetical protein